MTAAAIAETVVETAAGPMTDRREGRPSGRKSWRGIVIVLAVFAMQTGLTIVFIYDILASILGLRSTPISWQAREFVEMGAALGLVLGFALGAYAWRKALIEARQARQHLARAQSAFSDLMSDRFGDWGLTPAERDVALFAIKGLSTAEIAALRGTSEGTVKAQSNAIYRKAGVSSRSQLLSLFIEDLIGDAGPDSAAGASVQSAGENRASAA